MKIKEVTCKKELKIGLPNYSNISIGMYLTVEVGENEQPDYSEIWDTINHQLQSQQDLDPSWISTSELKKDWKLTIKMPKATQEEI